MKRLLVLMLVMPSLFAFGCSSSSNTSVVDGADQAAIDAYDAAVKANDESMGNYKEIK